MPIRIDATGITGMQPPVCYRRCIGFRTVPVSGGDIWSLDPELTGFAHRHIHTIFIDYARLGIHRKLTGRAGLRKCHFSVLNRHCGARLGHAVPLLQRQSLGLVCFKKWHRRRRTANPRAGETGEIRRRKIGMLAHEKVIRRHAEEMRQTNFRIFDDTKTFSRIESPHN